MSNIKQALESAIESLLVVDRKLPVYPNYKKVIRDCKSALAELESVEQEARVGDELDLTLVNKYWVRSGDKLYTSPQTREGVELIDADIKKILVFWHEAFPPYARAIEAKLRELDTKG